MTLASLAAAPIKATIGGREVEIHPATAYEIGICESSFLASLRRQAIESTIGLGLEQQQFAMNAVAEYAAGLCDDVTPLYNWVAHNIEGTVKLLIICIETSGGQKVQPRDVARWLESSGGLRAGTPAHDWLVRSGLRADPTVPPAGADNQKNQPSQSTSAVDTSAEPSSESATA